MSSQKSNQPADISVGELRDVRGVAIGEGARATYNEITENIYNGLTTEEVSTLMIELRNAEQPTVWDGRIPYLGLKAFQESDAQFFFGRERLVDELLERLKTTRFLVIAGPSGSGKSSLARAGLLHALKMGKLDGSDKWVRATTRPAGNPLEQIGLSMARLTKSPDTAKTLREAALTDPAALHQQIDVLLTDDPNQRCILLVDQFEEVFTQTKDDALRRAFFSQLITAATHPSGRTTVIFSMRSDFVSHCARYEQFNELLSQNFRQIGGMQSEELARAITLPALEVGAEIDPALVSQITFDMKGEVGALPLMSFALRDLFEAEKTRQGEPMDMTLAEYQRRGGLQKALERHAKRVFDTFSEEQIALAGSVFSKLVEVGQGRADTRRTVSFDELIPNDQSSGAVEEIVQAFAAEGVRLLATDSDGQHNERTVTITHEKLLEAWPWLNRLVEENRETIVLANRISDDALTWEKLNEDEGALYRGVRLAQAQELIKNKTVKLAELPTRFLAVSRELAEREEREREAQRQRELEQEQALAEANRIRAEEAEVAAQSLRQRLYYVGITLLIAMIATVAAIIFSITANRAEAVAQAKSTEAVQSRVQAQIESTKAIAGQETATVALGVADEQRGTAVAQSTIAFQQKETAEAAEATSVFNEEQAENQAATAEAERIEAQRLANVSLSQSLAALAGTISDPDVTNTDLNLLLALEALRLNTENNGDNEWLVDQSLRQILSKPDLQHTLTGGESASRNISVAYSQDGEYIAAGRESYTSLGGNYEVRVWEANNFNVAPLIFSGESLFPYKIAFSSDSQFIFAKGYQDDTQQLRVWNIESPDDSPVDFDGQSAFSPVGTQIAFADNQNKLLHIVDIQRPEETPIEFPTQTDQILSVAFSPSGERIAGSDKDGVVRIWDLRDPAGEPTIVRGYTDSVDSLTFSPNGKYIASRDFSNRVVRIVDLEDALTEVLSATDFGGYSGNDSLIFSPDSNYFGLIKLDRVLVWEMNNMTKQPSEFVSYTGFGMQGATSDVKFSPDSQYIAASSWDDGSGDNSIRIWDLSSPSNSPMVLSGHEWRVTSIAFSPDGESIVSGSYDQSVRVWKLNPISRQQVVLEGHTDWVNSVTFMPDGQGIVSSSTSPRQDDRHIHVWNSFQQGTESLRFLNGATFASHIALSPQGRFIVARSTLFGSYQGLRLWDIENPSLAPNYITEEGPNWIDFSPDGQHLATLIYNPDSESGILKEWNMAHLEDDPVIYSNTAQAWHGSHGSYSPDNQKIALMDVDGNLYIHKRSHPDESPSIVNKQELAAESLLGFSEDSNYIIGYAKDKHWIRMWNIESGEVETIFLSGKGDAVESVTLSSNRRFFVTGNSDWTVKVWDLLYPHKEPTNLAGHSGVVRDVAFSPDGKYIASGSDDRTIRVWPTLKRLAELACHQVSREGLSEEEWNLYIGDVRPWREEGQCDLDSSLPAWWHIEEQ